MLKSKFFKMSAVAGFVIAASSAFAADLPPQRGPAVAPPVVHTPAPQPSQWYFRGDLGISFSDADEQPSSKEAFAAGAGIGYYFTPNFRGDITFDGAFDYNFGNGVDSYAVLANLYADFSMGSAMKPYLGAGIGWGEVKGNGFKDDGLALSGMAGISYGFTPNVDLDVGYKLLYTDLSAGKTGGVSYWMDHMVRAGVRVNF